MTLLLAFVPPLAMLAAGLYFAHRDTMRRRTEQASRPIGDRFAAHKPTTFTDGWRF